MKQVYAPHTRKVRLRYRWRIPVLWAQPLLAITANLSSCEHRVAICTAANTLHHLPLHTLCPIIGSASSKCLCLGSFCCLAVRGPLERRSLTASSTFSGRFGVLAETYPGDDWKALCPFTISYDVRRFDLACISVTPTISDVVSSKVQQLGGPRQLDEQPTTFISTLTVPTEVLHTLTRDARVGDVARSEIAVGRGPARAVEFAV